MECPNSGLLCMPEMNPSTTWRARTSSREILAMVAGCKNRRGSSSVTATGSLHQPARRTSKGSSLAGPAGWQIKSRGENLLEPLVAGQLAVLGGRILDQLLDDR